MNPVVRTRRSRFDVLPSEVTLISLSETTVDSGATNEGIGSISMSDRDYEALVAASMVDFRQNDRADIDLTSGLPVTKKSRFTDTTIGVSFIPEPEDNVVVNDSDYVNPIPFIGSYEIILQEKKKSALIRNFEYLLKKDDRVNNPPIVIPSPQVSYAQYIQPLQVKESKKQCSAPTSSSIPSEGTSSVYVEGFPLYFEEEDLNILFTPHGKIKKIKLYTHSDGKLKGDALITFHRQDSALASCVKLSGLDLGDGYKLRVSRANFSSKEDRDDRDGMSTSNIVDSADVRCEDAVEQLLASVAEEMKQGGVGESRFDDKIDGDAEDERRDLVEGDIPSGSAVDTGMEGEDVDDFLNSLL